MNRIKRMGAVLTLLAAASTGFAASNSKSSAAKSASLAPGTYTAKVKTFVCEGCGPLVQKTLAADPAVGSVSVDQETQTATFTVKKGARADLASLQKSLDAAAQQMGMGADYGLSDVKKRSAKKASSNP